MLIGLDEGFQPLGALQCLNVQWNRRYYEAGDYMLQMRAADFDAGVRYVYAADRPETGMVEKVETEHNVKGDFVLVSGYFLEGMFNWKAVYPRFTADGNVAVTCAQLMAQHLADTGVAVPAAPPLGGSAAFDALGVPLGDATFAALRAQELGQRIRLNYAQGSLTYGVWQGLDRTQGQSQNAYAVFSQGFGTVDALTLTRDTSGLRNYAIALYEGGVLEVDARASTAEPKRILYLDTGMGPEQWGTGAALTAAVQNAARAALQARAGVLNIDVTALQRNAHYLADYDLGDRCDVRDDRLRMAFEARIIEVNEVWKDGAHSVSLQFGDKIPAAYPR